MSQNDVMPLVPRLSAANHRVVDRRLTLWCGTILAASVLFGCQARPDRPRRNIVLVVIDTLRRDHVSAYGYGRALSPTLDALAARGVALDGIAPSSWTKPSTASILTGRHPLRHRAIGRMDALPLGIETLAERLRTDGYTTVGVSANGWVTPKFGLSRGFEIFQYLHRRADESADAEAVAATASSGMVEALTASSNPFFLYAHFVDPHLPYEPHVTWDGTRNTAPAISVAATDATHFRRRPPAFVKQALDLYDGEIRQADSGVGEILEQLERLRVLDDTLVLVTADHGEEFEEHGRMSHGQTLYAESVQVPWIAAGPGVLPRGHVAFRASLMDIAPTILRWAGDERPFDSDGRELNPILAGNLPAADWGSREFLLHLDTPDGTALAMLQDEHKIVLARRPYRKELFDVASDPAEQQSLWDRDLSPRLAAFARFLGGRLAMSYATMSAGAPASRTANVKAEERAMFAALGYGGVGPSAHPTLPVRIRPPGPRPRGLLGWEPTDTSPCLNVGAGADNPSLLAGWFDADQNGRWTGVSATAAVSSPRSAATTLVLSGANFRGDRPRLLVTSDGETLLDTLVSPNGFKLRTAPVFLHAGMPRLLQLDVSPPFVPALQGMHDDRTLGIFLTSICLSTE